MVEPCLKQLPTVCPWYQFFHLTVRILNILGKHTCCSRTDAGFNELLWISDVMFNVLFNSQQGWCQVRLACQHLFTFAVILALFICIPFSPFWLCDDFKRCLLGTSRFHQALFSRLSLLITGFVRFQVLLGHFLAITLPFRQVNLLPWGTLLYKPTLQHWSAE